MSKTARPYRCVLGPTRFRLGDRVRHDFGKVPDIPRAQSRVAGTIVKSWGKLIRSEGFARWMHVVLLDEPFCHEREWNFAEDDLAPEAP